MKYITREKFAKNFTTLLDEIENDAGESVLTVLGLNDEPAIYVVTQSWYDERMRGYEESSGD